MWGERIKNSYFDGMLDGETAWGWVKMRMLELLPEENARCFNFVLLKWMFEQHVLDLEGVWLTATYVEFIWFEKLKRTEQSILNILLGI